LEFYLLKVSGEVFFKNKNRNKQKQKQTNKKNQRNKKQPNQTKQEVEDLKMERYIVKSISGSYTHRLNAFSLVWTCKQVGQVKLSMAFLTVIPNTHFSVILI